ncbi:DUF3515 family protein [Streptomyces sp. NPDC059452]|uniref:DUF3515 family protein n=1 Tax=Streptomyces sp. NPDC059452 TaxID=3346835 RepID=UPI0036B993C7
MTKSIRKPLRAAAALAACTAACTAFLAGCGSGDGYNLTKPPFAGNPACDTLTGKLPDELGGHSLEKSNVAGAAAWGDGDIILYCGMPAPDTSDNCSTEGGIDWVAQKPADDRTAKMFSTQGRSPSVQVRFRNETTDPSAVLPSLAPAMKDIKADGKGCDDAKS